MNARKGGGKIFVLALYIRDSLFSDNFGTPRLFGSTRSRGGHFAKSGMQVILTCTVSPLFKQKQGVDRKDGNGF